MIEQQIRDLFAETAGREPPAPAQVDLHLARRQGRARLRWRRAIVAGGSLLAAAAVTALLVAVVPGRTGAGPGPANPGPPAPSQFSPLITNLSFGWLPPGMSIEQGGVVPTEAFQDVELVQWLGGLGGLRLLPGPVPRHPLGPPAGLPA